MWKYVLQIVRWMSRHDDFTTETFAIGEYDSYEKYREIETNVRGDREHVNFG